MKPRVGDPAPAFNVDVVDPDSSEVKRLSLTDLRGQRVVLVFYPKDSTPGCTIQACAIRGEWSALEGRAAIFGVSVDDVKSCLLYTSPSPRDLSTSRMPSSA